MTVNGRGNTVTVVQAKRQGRNGERAVRVKALLSGQVADTAKIDLRTARAERARRDSREGWRRGEGRGGVVDGGNCRLVESGGVGEYTNEGALVYEGQDGASDGVGGHGGLRGDLLPGFFAADVGHDLDGGALDRG